MTLSFLVGLAFAARTLDVELVAPSGQPLAKETWELPHDNQEYTLDVGGVPLVVVLQTENRHDTVVVEAVVYEIGRKGKRKEIARPKLILYEEYPGTISVDMPVPRKAEGVTAPLSWTLNANWKDPEAE